MNAKEELQRVNTETTELATRRAKVANRLVAARKEREMISPKAGPDGIIVDPSDEDPRLRPRRAELHKEIIKHEADIAAIDKERNALEPSLNELRAAVQAEEANARRQSGYAALSEVALGAIKTQTGLRKFSGIFRESDALYPTGATIAPGVLIPARCGLPLLSNKVETMLRELDWLLRDIASWDASCVPSGHPAAVAATAEARFLANGVRSPIVESYADDEVLVEARIAPAPNVEEVAAMHRRRAETTEEERLAATAKL